MDEVVAGVRATVRPHFETVVGDSLGLRARAGLSSLSDARFGEIFLPKKTKIQNRRRTGYNMKQQQQHQQQQQQRKKKIKKEL